MMRHYLKGLVLALLLVLALPAAFALNAKQVYKKVKDSIYTVYVLKDARTAKARGSAVAVSSDILATNCHVALQGGDIVVKDYDKKYRAKIIYQNLEHDLCLLKIQTNVLLKPVSMRSAKTAEIGEEVFAIGNPRGSEKSLSRGVLSNKNGKADGVWLETDAAINFGSSGGGLFDSNGNLIGITTKMSGNFSFALPSDWIIKLLQEGINKNNNQNAAAKYEAAYRGLVNLGSFGFDNVTLYKNNKQCFILFRGKDATKNVRSLFLWNPKHPQIALVFPTTYNARQAMIMVYQMSLERKTIKPKAYRTNSILVFGEKKYPLFSLKSGSKKYLFFTARIPKNSQSILMNTKIFSADIKDEDHRIGYVKVDFGTRGFDDTLRRFTRDCGQ